MKIKLEVDTEVLMMTNNVLRAKANSLPPTTYLTDQQKEWWKVVDECQGSVKIYVNSKYENNINPNQFAKLTHPKEGFVDFFKKAGQQPKQIISKEEIEKLNKRGVFAPDFAQAAKDRGYTKYRIVVSDVPVLNADGTISKIKVMSTCAPNLMGTSPPDKKEFLDAAGNLNQEAYKKACIEIANLMAFAAKDSKISSVKIAEFGLGVYLRDLPDDQKNAARQIMYKAFLDAAEKHEVKFDWLIWNDPAKSPMVINKSVDRLNEGAFKGSKFIHAAAGDLLGDVPKWTKENPAVAEVNNGSDRTIGGAFTHFKPKTTEEQLAQASFLAFVQTTMNPYLTKDVKLVNTETGKLVGTMSPGVAPLEKCKTTLQNVFSLTAEQLKNSNAPDGTLSLKVQFNNSDQAKAFAEKLMSQGITSTSNPGMVKNVVNNAIFLTVNDYQKIHGQHEAAVKQLKQAAIGCLGLKNQDLNISVDKNSAKTNLLLSFPNNQKAQEMAQRLFDMGIKSTSKPTEKKSVFKDTQIILTAKDAQAITQMYSAVDKQISFLQTRFNLPIGSIRPSVSHGTNNVNLVVVFENKNEAEKYVAMLLKSGVGSTTNLGKPKSILPNNGIILTQEDCQKLQTAMGQPQKKANPVAFFKPSADEYFKRQDLNTEGFTPHQMGVFGFGVGCCDFPKLVVKLSDLGYDLGKASLAINMLDTEPKKASLKLKDVTDVLDAQNAVNLKIK